MIHCAKEIQVVQLNMQLLQIPSDWYVVIGHFYKHKPLKYINPDIQLLQNV
jgi:hypothetical protein